MNGEWPLATIAAIGPAPRGSSTSRAMQAVRWFISRSMMVQIAFIFQRLTFVKR